MKDEIFVETNYYPDFYFQTRYPGKWFGKTADNMIKVKCYLCEEDHPSYFEIRERWRMGPILGVKSDE